MRNYHLFVASEESGCWLFFDFNPQSWKEDKCFGDVSIDIAQHHNGLKFEDHTQYSKFHQDAHKS